MTQPAPETRLVDVAGRAIEVKEMAQGALLVLARVTRMRLDTPPELMTSEQRLRLMNNLGLLGEILDSIIVSETDRDWLATGLIHGEVTPEAALGLLQKTAEAFNKDKAPTTGPTKAVAKRVRK